MIPPIALPTIGSLVVPKEAGSPINAAGLGGWLVASGASTKQIALEVKNDIVLS
ncbi:MAG TPA: hypothetical protein VHN81_04860 [Edaphobacter sp.]|nr:hypothetical protein [Edaphobacter sp.]